MLAQEELSSSMKLDDLSLLGSYHYNLTVTHFRWRNYDGNYLISIVITVV